MPVQCYETPESRSIGADDATLRYRVDGTTDVFEARWWVLATSPAIFDSKVRQVPQIEPESYGVWTATVSYKKHNRESGDVEFQADIGGQSAKVTQSLETVGSYAPAGKTAPDFKGAIGVSRSGSDFTIEGVDIDAAEFTWSLKCRLPPATFTEAYWLSVYSVKAAPINNAEFYGFAAGEVKFLGASGSYREGEDYGEITFKFAASPNRTGLSVGEITNIAKDGWHYLWVYYEESTDATAKKLIKKPEAAYVERVYESSNFALLGIGT